MPTPPSANANPWSLLHLRVIDPRTRRPTPARFFLLQKDGTCYVPPAQFPIRTDDMPRGWLWGMCEESPRSKSGDPDEIPAVLTIENYRKSLNMARDHHRTPTHLATGEAAMPVPAGEFTLHIMKGFERGPIRKTFRARAGETTTLELTLPDIEDLESQGWHPGDMHVHYARETKRDDRILQHLMEAEDLRAVNNMVYKHFGAIEAHQRAMGHKDGHSHIAHHHQVVAGGEEFRDNDLYGHMISAGISKVIEPISTGRILGGQESYPLFAQVCDWTREQGGIAGWAHGGCWIKLHESLPMEAALRKLDFIEGIQFNAFMGFYFWYKLLNCGLPLAITGGSDYPVMPEILAPWLLNLGTERTYVEIPGTRRIDHATTQRRREERGKVRKGPREEFAYEGYIEGIRGGRCFATNGPLLWLEVEGKGVGDRVRVDSAKRKVRVKARALCAYPLSRLEIVVNGAVEKMVDGKGGPREIAWEGDVPLRESAWIAARVRGRVEAETYGATNPWQLHAHTSPVYVLRGGKRIGVKSDATWMADYIRFIGEVYRRRGHFKTAEQRAALEANLKKAERFYEGILRM